MGELAKERRRFFRVAVPGNALLWRGSRFAGRYTVDDLSLGGCKLGVGPSCRPGDHYEVMLRMRDIEALQLTAVVVRGPEAVAAEVGLRFVQHYAQAEDGIHDLVMRKLEHGDRVRDQVLLVHPRPLQVASMVAALERSGHRIRLACTPLEAIWVLEREAEKTHTAIIGVDVGGRQGLKLLRFISEGYPHMRRVLLTARFEDRLEADGHAHAVLDPPWEPKRLARVVPKPWHRVASA